MGSELRRVFVATGLLAAAGAVPVGISRSWGWLVTIVVALAGGRALARHVTRRYVEPVESLAEVVRAHVDYPGASAEDLARTVAYAYRDAVTQRDEAVSGARRRDVVLRHAVDGVVLLDASGLVEYANPTARLMLHEAVLDISRRLSSPELQRVVHNASELGSVVSEEVTVRTPAPKQVLARAIPLMADGAVLLLQDLSESYRLDKVRRDFVANVSHELKTPVASLRALADVAAGARADGDMDAAARFADKMRAESERLSELVADLLDLSAVETGRSAEAELVDVLELARTAVERARTIADVKRLPIEVEGDAAVVRGDPAQLTTALQNLVDNAVAYSEAGTVRVRVEPDDGWTRIDVSDHGIGIPEQDLPRIFERFYRVDRARSRATGGTGLGLSIVRHVAENHGGRVEVRSQLGAGSTFTLWIRREMSGS